MKTIWKVYQETIDITKDTIISALNEMMEEFDYRYPFYDVDDVIGELALDNEENATAIEVGSSHDGEVLINRLAQDWEADEPEVVRGADGHTYLRCKIAWLAEAYGDSECVYGTYTNMTKYQDTPESIRKFLDTKE